MKRRIFSLSLSLITTLALLFLSVPQPLAHASAANPAGCYYPESTYYIRYVESDTQGESLGCQPINAFAYEYSLDCTDQTYSINVDLWLSHGTVPGSARYGDSGRSGYYTYPGDCQWHAAPNRAVARVDNPDFACAWAQVYGAGARDYMCTNNNTIRSGGSGLLTTVALPKMRGKTRDTLVTPNGLQLTLLNIKHDGSLLLFQYHAYNSGKQTVSLIGSGADNQFYYVQSQKFTRTSRFSVAQQATYGPLPPTLAPGASANGWATIAVTPTTQNTFDTVLYRFGATPSLTCTNLQDKTACHSDEAFQALVWNF
ncbi:MAG: hypothetical protein H0V70_06525 [Ktedonobacteraceae bacterium]|nr:hypothetical protein [Ktedonobacteraceae bacterium]